MGRTDKAGEAGAIVWVVVERALDWCHVTGAYSSREEALVAAKDMVTGVNPMYLVRREIDGIAGEQDDGERIFGD